DRRLRRRARGGVARSEGRSRASARRRAGAERARSSAVQAARGVRALRARGARRDRDRRVARHPDQHRVDPSAPRKEAIPGASSQTHREGRRMTFEQPPRLKDSPELGAVIRAAGEANVTPERLADNAAGVKALIAAGATTALWKLVLPVLLLLAV